MTDIIDENWRVAVYKTAQKTWLAYAYYETNTTGAFALERHIRSKTPGDSRTHSNKYKLYGIGKTQPSKATIREVEGAAFGATVVLDHTAWRLLAYDDFSEQDHLAALQNHGIDGDMRLFADRKLPVLVKAKNIEFFDRLEIALHLAGLAALRGDVFLFKQTETKSEFLFNNLPEYFLPGLTSDLHSLVRRWCAVKRQKTKKKQIALMNSRTDFKLMILALLILISPVFQHHAGIQTLSVITGTALLLASFEPRLRYWWAGYQRNPAK
jgi:hypothetical protein